MAVMWGRTGHYGVTTLALRFMDDTVLRDFFTENLERISYSLEKIGEPDFDQQVDEAGEAGGFIPLADVPDEIWKKRSKLDDPRRGRVGGRANPGGAYVSGPENPNHYADVDIAPKGQNVSWRDQCLADPNLISPDVWNERFYDHLPHEVGRVNRGLAPFRVWQLLDAMDDCLRGDDVDGFLVAAGVCAHYVGDSCQPMHGSVMSNGDRSRTKNRIIRGEATDVPFGTGSHEWYESLMVANNAPAVFAGVAAAATSGGHGLERCATGKDAARATLQLMAVVARILPPLDIVNSFQKALSDYDDRVDPAELEDDNEARTAITSAMWEQLGPGTIRVMVEGARYLAMIWESGWERAGCPELAVEARDKQALTARYIDPEFLPSKQIDHIGALLRYD